MENTETRKIWLFKGAKKKTYHSEFDENKSIIFWNFKEIILNE